MLRIRLFTNNSFGKESAAITLLLILYTALELGYGSLDKTYFLDASNVHTKIFIATTIAIFFLCVRIIMPRAIAFLFLTTISFILFQINHAKYIATNDPIGWADLTSYENYSIALAYMDWIHVVFIALALFAILIVLRVLMREMFTKKIIIQLSLFLGLLIVLFSPETRLYYKIAEKYGISYSNWDAALNARNNGIILNLLQSGNFKRPHDPSDDELASFFELKKSKRSEGVEIRPKIVVYILCESCWYSSDFFSSAFKPMNNFGFSPFRVVSPEYGGNTSQIDFEVLTGLPSNTRHLSRQMFSTYGNFFKDDSENLAKAFVEHGYTAIALHNYYGRFWNRDTVFDKFGFNEYISLDQMDVSVDPSFVNGDDWRPSDGLLFNEAYKVISENPDKHIFMYLITMNSHGPYRSLNDLGEADYYSRLQKSINEIVSFVQKVKTEEPDTLFFVFGDHKPGLTDFFLSNHVFSFSDSVSIIGDVPAFLYYDKKPNLIHSLSINLNNLTFYCASSLLNNAFFKFFIPAMEWSQRTCQKSGKTEKSNAQEHPAWLYAFSLFKDPLNQGSSE